MILIIIDNCNISMDVKDMEKVIYNVEDAADVTAAQELRKEIGDNNETKAAAPEFLKKLFFHR
jgi:hypothetical protein